MKLDKQEYIINELKRVLIDSKIAVENLKKSGKGIYPSNADMWIEDLNKALTLINLKEIK